MVLTYRKEGDYFLPNLEVPAAPKIGKYGMLRRSYLRQYQQGIYTGLMFSGKLNQHLAAIDQQATEMVERLISQLAKAENVTEELKAENQLEWVGLMNNIQARAEEIVLKELVYT